MGYTFSDLGGSVDETRADAVPAPAAETPSVDPRLDALKGAQDRILEKITVLEQLFVKRIKDDPVHAAAYTSLHQEMTKYRDDAFRQSQKPLLKGMILLYDTMQRSLDGMGDGEPKNAVQLHVEELVELLHRHDVEIMRDAPAKFDPKLQAAIGTEPAGSPDEDQRVARVVRHGFRWGPHVLRPQEVIIKVLQKG